MKKFLQNIRDGFATNALWWMVTTLISIVAPHLFNLLANISFIFTGWVLYLQGIVIVLSISSLIYQYKYRQYPKPPLFFRHINNEYIISFIDRETLEYVKRIQVKPMQNGLEKFDKGDYRWTGDASSARIIESGDFRLEMLSEENGCQYYNVIPKCQVKKSDIYEYTIAIDLADTNHNMQPHHYIYIKRPTKSIKLILNIPTAVKIKNVKYLQRASYGEELILNEEKPNPVHNGGVSIGQHTYVYKVKNPKLFCYYEIIWEWDTE